MSVTEILHPSEDVIVSVAAIPKQMSILEIEKSICNEIRKAENEIREQYPIFHRKYQDLLGAVALFGSIGMIGLASYCYLNNPITVWSSIIAIFSVAFWTSFVHEMEHDFIHNLYFKSNDLVHSVLFMIIWVVKMSYSPFDRKVVHLRHHRVSGHYNDLEERFIGLGTPVNWRRAVLTAHPIAMLLALHETELENPNEDYEAMIAGSVVSVLPVFVLVYVFMIVYGGLFVFYPELKESSWAQSTVLQWIFHFNILNILPGILRQGCLQLMSNSSHYYGDIPRNSLFYQNQIMDHWCLIPFQLFCFNFGATHIIHHYVPQQPFYIRQLVYGRVRDFMVSKGVRANDFDAVFRGNRYFKSVEEARKVLGENSDVTIPPLPATMEATVMNACLGEVVRMMVWSGMTLFATTIAFPITHTIVTYAFLRRLFVKAVWGKVHHKKL
jgi:hypothetical protein